MQTVTSQFIADCGSKIRKLYWGCLISFQKTFASGITFFTIGTSTIGGTDIIKGVGDVVQEWDKYNYTDYTNRVISFEYTREQDPYLGGGVLSMADVTLDNHDDWFTPNNPHSDIRSHILPWRPIRLYAGFRNEAVPVFVGLTEKMPSIDEKGKTVTFHCIDFMQKLFNYPLDESVIYQNQTTDYIIGQLLQLAGLGPTQYILDSGFNIVDFFYAKKGDKLGTYLRKLAQAELGRIYMDEYGIIRFVNRTNWTNNIASSWHFDKSNILDRRSSTEDNLINVVEVKADVREVLANQKFWELQTPIQVPANSSINIWADFSDPVTGVDDPVYITSATTSFYTTNKEKDGSGEAYSANISLSAISKFATSCKMTFANDNATTPIYITTLELFATPAKVTHQVYARYQDDDSVEDYHERPVVIENEFIPDESTGNSLATIVVTDNKDYNDYREIEVVGAPQLQIGDLVGVSDENQKDTYYITKIVGKMVDAKFTQVLTVVKKTINKYFRIGISTIGGSDQIAP